MKKKDKFKHENLQAVLADEQMAYKLDARMKLKFISVEYTCYYKGVVKIYNKKNGVVTYVHGFASTTNYLGGGWQSRFMRRDRLKPIHGKAADLLTRGEYLGSDKETYWHFIKSNNDTVLINGASMKAQNDPEQAIKELIKRLSF